MTETKIFVCACGLKNTYELDMSIQPGGHISMVKHCPACKREMPLGRLLNRAKQDAKKGASS